MVFGQFAILAFDFSYSANRSIVRILSSSIASKPLETPVAP